MKVIRVIASVIQNNSYLLLTKKPVIIDPCEYNNVVLNNLKKHIRPKQLKCIILTHFHDDHTLATLKIKEATNAEILIHELDVKFLDFKPDRTLKGNETLNLGDFKLRVIHTPGHTLGSICLYEPKTKSLFSGDTVFPYGIGRTDFPESDKEQMVESLKRLSNLDVRILYPGHGEVTDKNVNEQIKNSLRLTQISI